MSNESEQLMTRERADLCMQEAAKSSCSQPLQAPPQRATENAVQLPWSEVVSKLVTGNALLRIHHIFLLRQLLVDKEYAYFYQFKPLIQAT